MENSKARDIADSNGLDPETVERIDTHGPEKRKNYRSGKEEIFYVSVHPEPALPRTRTEAEIYQLIGENTGLRTPPVIDYGEDYILVKGLSGDSYADVFEEASDERRSEIVSNHAEALAEIHSIEVIEASEEIDGFGEFTEQGFKRYDSWKDFIEERLSSYESRASDALEQQGVKWLKENIDAVEADITPRIVHDDFHIWNTITGETIGVIDAEQAFIGDPVYDLVKTVSRWTDHYNMTDEFLNHYLEKHKIEDFEQRFNFYKVENYLRGTINAREKIEKGQEELQKFYENDRDKLKQALNGE